MLKGAVVVVGDLLHIHLHFYLNCVQGVAVVEGVYFMSISVHRQMHIYDAIGSLVFMML